MGFITGTRSMHILWPALPSIVMSENVAVVFMRKTRDMSSRKDADTKIDSQKSHFTINYHGINAN